MRKIGGPEARILKKYMKSRVIDPEDKDIIKRLKTIGLIETRFSIEQPTKRTAKTTDLGWRGI